MVSELPTYRLSKEMRRRDDKCFMMDSSSLPLSSMRTVVSGASTMASREDFIRTLKQKRSLRNDERKTRNTETAQMFV
jgi:hypothetical protein